MRLTFTGTATSQGIPVIGCDCEVCTSTDPRDRRLRTSALLEWGEHTFCFDVGPDFRQQMLAAGVSDLTAVLITHEHNDHVAGADDVRPLNFRHRKHIPFYALPRVNKALRERFPYVFETNPYPGAPRIDLHPLTAGEPLTVAGKTFTPVPILHGKLPIVGFKFGNSAYLTDVKYLPEAAEPLLLGLDVLVISALHREDHWTHLKLDEALEYIRRLAPRQAYLTHLSHRMGTHAATTELLPDNVAIAYDGLVVECE